MSTREHLQYMVEKGVPIPAAIVMEVIDEVLAEGEPDRQYTTAEASERFGLTDDYWQDACRDKLIPGAWREGENGRWRLPDRGIRAHLARKSMNAKQGGRRGPYRKASGEAA